MTNKNGKKKIIKVPTQHLDSFLSLPDSDALITLYIYQEYLGVDIEQTSAILGWTEAKIRITRRRLLMVESDIKELAKRKEKEKSHKRKRKENVRKEKNKEKSKELISEFEEYLDDTLRSDPTFMATWIEFEQHRKTIKQALSALATKRISNRLKKNAASINHAVQMLAQSIEAGWTNVYDLPKNRVVSDTEGKYDGIGTTIDNS